MKLKEYIEMLQDYQKNNPQLADIEVVITQQGYYADGGFADIYDEPEFETKTYNNVEYSAYNYQTKTTKVTKQFIVLGHSSQNY